MAEHPPRKSFRCAIYTRKSSEEGLDQDFNSLHAQREACETFVASQKHEGWRAVAAAYDDGGFSGGSMERPSLQRLLTDVAARQVDVVVVYKVDRLTRSLTDFARIVEVFDKHGASFVSVTQAFNTTTSMGRLTLNVLLSFAQFEREVTGERIRDKIAASKKKGLWMGGYVPIGYKAAGRTLAIDEEDAPTIRTIYTRYLALKSVDALKSKLDQRGVTTKPRCGGGRSVGGKPFSRGHLYRILSNPIYAGRIVHKGQTFDGQHPAIIDQATFEAVQATLAANSHARLVKAHAKNPSLLSGLLFDESGEKLVASHANKQGRRYRYYLSPSALKSRRQGSSAAGCSGSDAERSVWRLPAGEIEAVVTKVLVEALLDEHWLAVHVHDSSASIAERRAVSAHAQALGRQLEASDPLLKRGIVLALIDRVILRQSEIEIRVKTAGSLISPVLNTSEPLPSDRPEASGIVSVRRALSIRRRGPETRLVIEGSGPPEPEPDPALIKAVAQAHRWWQDLLAGRYATIRELAAAYTTDERYAAWVLRLVFLSPDITRRILDGVQPTELTLHSILKVEKLPIGWREQDG